MKVPSFSERETRFGSREALVISAPLHLELRKFQFSTIPSKMFSPFTKFFVAFYYDEDTELRK